MMRPNINYYALLGVTSTATPEEITKAYRKKILQVHLDKLTEGEDTSICYQTIEAHRVLSDRNLRSKYDIQRTSADKAQETFIPAGYICYDVKNQMSKRVIENIAKWKKEFEEIQSSSNKFSDNYFQCFSALMGQVIDKDENNSSETANNNSDETYYFCKICDKKFLTETHHWEDVIYPYCTMFSCDNPGIGSIITFFQSILGPTFFNWEPRYLPSRLLGIWGSDDWATLTKCDTIVANILELVEISPDDDFSFVKEQVSFIQETFLSDSETDGELYPEIACKCIIWVLEHQDDQDEVVNKINDLLTQDDLQELLFLTSVMKNLLECGKEEWEELAKDALENSQPELAMFWTKIGFEFEKDDEEDSEDEESESESKWFELGMKIHEMDPVLAHFCFLFGDYESQEDWEILADNFTQKKNHFAAMEYHLNKGNLNNLLDKSRKLLKTDPEGAPIYRKVYFSIRIKTLLEKLRTREGPEIISKTCDEELEELIDMVQELSPNPLEGFRLIVTTWPACFESPSGHSIHRGTMRYLMQSRMSIKSYNLLVALMHFLPSEELDEELLSSEATQLSIREMEKGVKSSDFESLTDILLFINRRSLLGAKHVLNGMEEIQAAEKPKSEESVDPQNPPLLNLNSHTKSMMLLISGTINKVEKNWMGAMTDYQNALLCNPECMHRVLPCISKLSQDIEFHEAVVGEVQLEVKELKELFDSEEYPEVDTYGDKRQSLVITDVAPKTDFGYKNSMNKIQADPDQVAQPPPAEPMDAPPVEANTPLITLDKNEEAIESGQGGPLAELNAALAYVDLLKALPLQFQPGPIVMAASHFLKAMDGTKDLGCLFAYRNAINLMAENLLRIDRKTQATIQHCLTHKHMLSLLLSSHEKLSKALGEIQEDDTDSNSTESEPEEKSCQNESICVDLIKKSDANLISKFLKNVVNFPKIEPLANIPTLNCSDLVYVETLGNSFMSQFCSEKVRQKRQSLKLPKSLHAYTHFVEVWKGRSLLMDFGTARLRAMDELLALKDWTLKDVEDTMTPNFLCLTEEGWSSEYMSDLWFPDSTKAFRSIHGFKIDYESGEVSLLLSRERNQSGNFFDTNDIMEIFSNGIDQVTLSLDTPDLALRSHPFKKANFESDTCMNKELDSIAPNYAQSLTRVAMLICFLTSGMEICAKSPFFMRPTDEGLLHRLEEHLQYLLRPVKNRKDEDPEGKFSSLDLEFCNKFWLQMTEVFEEIEEEEDTFVYKVGDVRPQVKMNTFVMTLNGGKASLSPEGEFARDFTRHYDEIGSSFPELLRLKELVKISIIYSKLKEILEEKTLIIKQNGRSKDEICKMSSICEAIAAFGININENKSELNLACKGKSKSDNLNCPWLPATFCHNMDPEIYEVTAGVRMTPEVTYGPVSVPSDCIYIPVNKLLKLDNFDKS